MVGISLGAAERLLPELKKHELDTLRGKLNVVYNTKFKRTYKHHPKYGQRSVAFDEEELARFFRAVKPHQYQHKTYFLTLLGLGLRPSEGARLKLEDIDFEKKEVYYPDAKNKKQKVKYLSDALVFILQDYINIYAEEIKQSGGWIFFSRYYPKRHISTGVFRAKFNEILQLAGLKKVYGVSEETFAGRASKELKTLSLKSFRHSFGTQAYMTTRDIYLTKLLMNHDSLTSTLTYVHAGEQEKKTATEKLFALNLMETPHRR